MNFSNNYIFFRDNQSLEQAIHHYKEVAPENTDTPEEDKTASSTTTPYHYSHTQNTGHSQLGLNTLESMKQAFDSVLTESSEELITLESLASVLAAIGQHKSDAELLNQSVDTFNKALELHDSKETPEEWATTQKNLANVLLVLAQLESKSKWFKASEEANLSALTVFTRETSPNEWASIMHTLGITFHLHGKLLNGNRVFQKSVVAYKNAISKLEIEDNPVDRSMTNNNRGAVLQHMAEREENAERMEEAIRAFEQSLLIWDEQLLPRHIATMIMANRSTARTTLAELSNDKAIAQEAADELVVITEIFSDACHDDCLEHCREQLIKAEHLAETLASA